MRENKTIPEVDEEQRGRPMLRLLIGIGVFACAILAFLVIGAMTHRDEGGVTQVKSREEVLEAVQGVPDVIVPELAEAENVSYTVHTGGHGSDTEFVGYGMAWKGSLGERELLITSWTATRPMKRQGLMSCITACSSKTAPMRRILLPTGSSPFALHLARRSIPSAAAVTPQA